MMSRHHPTFRHTLRWALIPLAMTLLVGAALAQAPDDPSQPSLELVGSDDFVLGPIYVIFEPSIPFDFDFSLLPPVVIKTKDSAGNDDVSPNQSGAATIGRTGKGAGAVAIDVGASLILPSSGADPMPRILTPADVLGELEQLHEELSP